MPPSISCASCMPSRHQLAPVGLAPAAAADSLSLSLSLRSARGQGYVIGRAGVAVFQAPGAARCSIGSQGSSSRSSCGKALPGRLSASWRQCGLPPGRTGCSATPACCSSCTCGRTCAPSRPVRHVQPTEVSPSQNGAGTVRTGWGHCHGSWEGLAQQLSSLQAGRSPNVNHTGTPALSEAIHCKG